MSFVIRAYSATGKLQLHEDFPSPQFMGKIITANDNIISQQGGEFGYETRSYSGTAPNFHGRDVIIFWSLPQGVQWLMQSTYAIAAASGSANMGGFAFCAPGTVITGAPIGYVFALGAPLQSAEQFCARAWDGGGNLIFDSGIPTLSPHQAPVMPSFVPGQTSTVTLDRALPANPAFLMPRVTRDEEVYEGYLSGSSIAHKREWWGSLQHSNGIVQARFPLVEDEDISATNSSSRAGYSEIQTYGNSAGLILPIINASTYD